MNSQLLLAFLALVLASCAPRTLKQEFPSAWNAAERGKSPRWVVAYPASHASALDPLKRAREKQGYEVISIPAADPGLIASRLARLKLGERKDDSLLLVGTVSSLPGPPGVHHRMKGIPSDARYAMVPGQTTPLFAVGRLPASSPAQTRMLVDRILAFERERRRSAPKQAVLLVGDPIGGTERMKTADFLIASLSRSLLRRADRSWTFRGAADVPGHPFACASSDFPAAFRRELDKPYAVAAYFGHSNAEFLCQTSAGTGTLEGTITHSFSKESWDNLRSSHSRGLFLSCGCYCLKDDAAVGYRSMQARGGPVAFIGATGESYGAIGYLAAKGAVGVMDEQPPRTVGEWFLAIQDAIARAPLSPPLFFAFDRVDGSSGKRSLLEQRKEHLEMWMLVGDPATRIF